MANTFNEMIEKFNPYHDRLGRFTFSNRATSFTYRPGQSRAHDMAIMREKERMSKVNKIISISQKKVPSILEDSGVETDKKEVTKEIMGYFERTAINGGIKWDPRKNKVIAKRSSIEEMKKMAKDIMSKQEYEDDSTSSEYHEMRSFIKNTPIRIERTDTHDIADWNDYRKKNFGNMTISRNGISIDSLYQELSSMYPHYFNSDRETHPADQLQRINDTLSHLKPSTYRLSGSDLESATDYLATTMLREFVMSVAAAS